MDSIRLKEDQVVNSLFPLTLTRSVLDIRVGILTLRERWQAFSIIPEFTLDAKALPAGIIASESIAYQLKKNNLGPEANGAKTLSNVQDIFQLNGEILTEDFALVTAGKTSEKASRTNQLICPERIFIESGAVVNYSILNATKGPIYIGKNAEIMEGCMIRGPFALCENGVLKMGTKIYGGTTIGKHSIVAGELKNAVIGDYSNKAHDGYLGDSVIGQWCNIGAGSSCSNIKNTATPVKIWNSPTKQYVKAGLKCGLIMGDYSRCAVNTSFNTGAVVGVCCNIFGRGLTPNYIPSFSWGFGEARYELPRALEHIQGWKTMKNQSITDDEIQTLKHIFELSKHDKG